jgi:hypothetical protein
MTRNQIIKMARKAEFVNLDLCSSELIRFAKLVAEAEREKCAKVCDKLSQDMTPIASMSAWACGVMIRARGQA